MFAHITNLLRASIDTGASLAAVCAPKMAAGDVTNLITRRLFDVLIS